MPDRLERRVAALEGRLTPSAQLGVLVFPAGLPTTELPEWIERNRHALPAGQAFVVIPAKRTAENAGLRLN